MEVIRKETGSRKWKKTVYHDRPHNLPRCSEVNLTTKRSHKMLSVCVCVCIWNEEDKGQKMRIRVLLRAYQNHNKGEADYWQAAGIRLH